MEIGIKRFIQSGLVGLIVLTVSLVVVNAQSESALRVVHALPRGFPADVYVDDDLFFSNVSYRTVTDYRRFTAGSHRVRILPAGASSEDQAAIEADLSFAAGKAYTLIALGVGGEGGAELRLFEDDNSPPPAGKARVRALHASPDTPPVDICVIGQDRCPVIDLSFKNATQYVTLDASNYSFELRRTGTNEVILLVPDLRFDDGVVFTLFLMGLWQGEPGLQVIASADSIRAPIEPPDTGALLSPTALVIVILFFVTIMVGGWFAWQRFIKN